MDKSREIDILQRDRYELVSAYIDGEVTVKERKQVQEWLDTDPQIKCLYHRLLQLRQEMQNLPVPCQESSEISVKKVFCKIQQRRLKAAFWTVSGVLSAVFIGTIASMMSVPEPGIQTANNSNQIPSEHKVSRLKENTVQSTNLMVALNEPIIEIPKAPISNLGKDQR